MSSSDCLLVTDFFVADAGRELGRDNGLGSSFIEAVSTSASPDSGRGGPAPRKASRLVSVCRDLAELGGSPALLVSCCFIVPAALAGLAGGFDGRAKEGITRTS